MTAAAAPPTLPGRPLSAWLDDVERPSRPALERDLKVDVAVVGAGIVGLSTAFELQRRGVEVAVLEARQVGSGVTGNTTAKLSALHGLSYDSLRSMRGTHAAAIYAAANEWGIERVAEIAGELEIECDLRRKPNFTYTETPDKLAELEDEVDALREAGLQATLERQTELPFEVAGAIRVDGQAEFQPVGYLVGLAAELDEAGAAVHERTRVTAVRGTELETEAGPRVLARHVVLATQLPISDRGLYFARAHVQRSYATSLRIHGEAPQGMYLQSESPGISLRTLRWRGEELLLVGGESHELGHADPREKFESLERYARERFDVESFEHRWSAHDFMSEDGLPYVGAQPWSDGVLIATGMSKWGLAMGAAAGRMLADRIAGEESAWDKVFDPSRLPPLRATPQLAKHNADSGLHFFADRARRGPRPADLAAGDGAVIGDGLGQKAVHRDDAGVLHAVSARCTHLGCIIGWNGGEGTWDCPCHGSRFEATGAVIAGPATRPLEPREVTEDG
jgi:glycine/D-amino acid oxidase-like deaminating enzyme/nitrite reductase/ring-hydroxylating ferredoxin subunit